MAQTASGGMSRVIVVRVGDLAFMRLLLSLKGARSLPGWVARFRGLVTEETLRSRQDAAQAGVAICAGEMVI
jgi:hypothetical protein